MTNRILVTGLSGFVGRWLERELIRQPDTEVFGLSSDGGEPVDIQDRQGVSDAVAALQPTAIVHLAAIAAPADARGDPHRAWMVNVIGTLNLASACLAKTPEAKFIFVGSSESYGESFNQSPAPVDEDASLKPMTAYAATKAAADLLVGQLARDGLQAVRFRPFNHTGPEQTDAYVVPAFASQIARIEAGLQQPVMQIGSLDAERDFLDVRDVVRAYALACAPAFRPRPGIALNLSTGKPRRIGDILDHLVKRSSKAIEIRTDPARVRPNDVPVSSGDPARAATVLDWRPARSLDQTLDDVLDYWRACTAP